MKVRNLFAQSALLASVALLCVVGAEAVANPVPVPGCCESRTCYDSEGKETGSLTMCVSVCPAGQNCVKASGCDVNGLPWVSVSCQAPA